MKSVIVFYFYFSKVHTVTLLKQEECHVGFLNSGYSAFYFLFYICNNNVVCNSPRDSDYSEYMR